MGTTGTGAGGPTRTDDEWETRKEIFRQSYSEVLAALKHQDDKLGRALAAQAFLTGAGIGIFTQLGRTATLSFDAGTVTAPLVLFVTFLVAIALALSFTLSAIGPSTPYKKSGGRRGNRSLIFYASIAEDPEWEGWLTKTSDEDLKKQLATNFHGEAENLAQRVKYKIARSREAAAFLNLAITSLAVLGIFSLELEEHIRWSMASGALLVSAALPLWDFLHMYRLEFPEGDPDPTSYLLLLASILSAAAVLMLAPSRGAEWWALGLALALVLASRWGLIGRVFALIFLGATAVGGLAILGAVIASS